MKRFRRQGSLYRQMLIFFFAAMVPVQAFGGFILLRGAAHTNRAVLSKAEQTAQSAAVYLSEQYDLTLQTLHSLLYSDNTKATALLGTHTPNDYSYWISARAIMKELQWARLGCDSVAQICLFYPSLNVLISENTYTDKLSEAFWEDLRASWSSRHGNLLGMRDGKLTLILGYPNILPGEKEPLAYCEATLSLNALCASISQRVFAGECVLTYRGQCIGGWQPGTQWLRENSDNRATLENIKYHVFYAGNPNGLGFVNFVPNSILLTDVRNFSRLLILYFLLCIPFFVGYAALARGQVQRPVKALLDAFEQVRSGNVRPELAQQGPEEMSRLIRGFQELTEHLDETTQRLVEQQNRAQQIEFKQLQSQINPHFLYNTFYMLERLVQDEETDAAAEVCQYLGGYFRYITRSGQETVPVSSEYEHMLNYLNLQKLRWEERLELDIAPWPQEALCMRVPRLIFQPIVENAFTHGFQGMSDGMRIRFSTQLNEDTILLKFENSAVQSPADVLATNLDVTPDEETTGLKNIHRRIRLKYGSPFGLKLLPSDLGGLCVLMLLPR